MCKYPQEKINNLPIINKIIANRVLVEAQLACSKAGGKITRQDLLNMSLEHFICLCSMNQITIELK